jgi:hypothetical protein
MPENNTKVLQLDPDDIVMAMQDQSVEWMLDAVTGKPCLDPDDARIMFGEEYIETWTPSDPARQLPIPVFTSSDAFRLMEDFVFEVASPEARESLAAALDQRKPFRRFKDALYDFEADRQLWFQFEATAMRRIAEDFYLAEGFVVRWIEAPTESTGLRQ